MSVQFMRYECGCIRVATHPEKYPRCYDNHAPVVNGNPIVEPLKAATVYRNGKWQNVAEVYPTDEDVRTRAWWEVWFAEQEAASC